MTQTIAPPEVDTLYVLGAPIALEHLLALPPDGQFYTRDEEGRLALMSPDNQQKHGLPIVVLVRTLNRKLGAPWWVLHERACAFDEIYNLKGKRLPESFLGPRALIPDLAIHANQPEYVIGPHEGAFFSSAHLRVVIEVLSARNWRENAGVGKADKVDKRRSYLASRIPEYWMINPAVTAGTCPVPARSALALRNTGVAWEPIPLEGRVVRSRAVPELSLDLDAFFTECGL